MANMSYCRFQNTVRDLRQCQSGLDAIFNVDDTPLSNDESDAAVDLIKTCKEILEMVESQLAGRGLLDGEEKIMDIDEGHLVALIMQANQECKFATDESADL